MYFSIPTAISLMLADGPVALSAATAASRTISAAELISHPKAKARRSVMVGLSQSRDESTNRPRQSPLRRLGIPRRRVGRWMLLARMFVRTLARRARQDPNKTYRQ